MSDCCGGASFPSAAWPALAGMTPAWTPLTLINSWVNYGGTYQTAQYRKLGDMVQIRGVIKTGASGTIAFTLPAGYRPAANEQFPINGPGVYASAEVTPAGSCVVNSAGGTTAVAIEFQFSVTP